MTLSIVIIITLVIIAAASRVECVSAAPFRELCAQQPYFSRMSAADLHARRHQDAAEYLKWYQAQARDWSAPEQVWMRVVANTADIAMRRVGLARYIMPWRFAIAEVEQGFPHTHADVIVWTETVLRAPFQAQVKLAVHEMVHVWQRLNPDDARLEHVAQGYQYTAPTPDTLLRNNPDTDLTTWSRDGRRYASRYRNATPHDLNDVEGPDHPNEAQAYRIADAAINNE